MKLALNQLERQLRAHDWFFSMSDDYLTYIQGREESIRLARQAKAFGQEGLDLYNRIKTEMTES